LRTSRDDSTFNDPSCWNPRRNYANRSLLGNHRIPEPHRRIPPRLFSGHPACHVLLNPHVYVRTGFSLNLAISLDPSPGSLPSAIR
jgi:hypothetical protein